MTDYSALHYSKKAEKWAVGTIVETPEGSAKYWADQAKSAGLGDSVQKEVSNLITEIPQNITLSLSEGTLTLAAGSKGYLGSGTAVTVASNVTKTSTENGQCLVGITSDGTELVVRLISRCVSGSGVTATRGFAFDTATSKVNNYDNSGTLVGECTLPIAIVTVDGTSIVSIDQVFNGVGFIGSTNFVLPGVKGTYPDGRNEDGTPKSGYVAVNNILYNTNTVNGSYHMVITSSALNNYSNLLYNATDNVFYNSGDPHIQKLFVGTIRRANSKVDAIFPLSVMGVVKYDELTSAVTAINNVTGQLVNLETKDKSSLVNAINEVNRDIKSTITNCLTEIPQDIHLTLSSGVLTLKKDSVSYKPDGVGVFTKTVLASDVTTNPNATFTDGQNLVFDSGSYSGTSLRLSPFDQCFSGDTAPANPSHNVTSWYNTTENIIRIYFNNEWKYSRSLPIAIVTVTDGAITSIDQIFNGFGFIGSTNFVLPGVKGLIPNGRNSDGTLKNEEVTVSSVLTNTGTYNSTFHIMVTSSQLNNFINVYYNAEDNILWNDSNPQILKLDCGVFTRSNGAIVSMTPKSITNRSSLIIPSSGKLGNLISYGDGGFLEWAPSGTTGHNNNKTVGIFGGSFATTSLAGTSFKEFERQLGVTCETYAVSGAGFVYNAKNFVYQATNAEAKDIYIIWCSTNDFTHDVAIGDKDDVYGTDTTVWANFKEVIRILYSKNPLAKICLFTTNPVLNSSQGNEEGYGNTTTHTNTVKEHVEAQKAMCALYSIPCLDQYTRSNMNSYNKSRVCKSDGLHLTTFGYEMLLNNQIDFLLSV